MSYYANVECYSKFLNQILNFPTTPHGGTAMAAIVTFPHLSMCWNSYDVKPFAFNNTMRVEKDHPVDHLVGWTVVVARGAPDGRLKALVVNCHGYYDKDYTGTTDSAGGIPRTSGGFGLKIGSGINADNADLFRVLSGLVAEIHLYACGAGSTPLMSNRLVKDEMCQIMANASKAVVVASTEFQPDVLGPGLNQAPQMAGTVIRFVPRMP